MLVFNILVYKDYIALKNQISSIPIIAVLFFAVVFILVVYPTNFATKIFKFTILPRVQHRL